MIVLSSLCYSYSVSPFGESCIERQAMSSMFSMESSPGFILKSGLRPGGLMLYKDSSSVSLPHYSICINRNLRVHQPGGAFCLT